MSPRAGDRRAVLAVPLLGVLWGLNWPAVRLCLVEIPPWTLRTTGMAAAGLCLLGAALATGRPLFVPRAQWPRLAASGLLALAAFNVLLAFAQLHAATSRAAIVAFTMPVWTALLAWPLLGERPDRRRLLGLALGVAGLLAGACSMGAGEYVSMRLQREVFERLLHLEAHEIAVMPEEERRELAEIYRRKGLSPELADRIALELMRDPRVALETHAREELGLDPGELGSPWGAAVSSFLTFAFGALVPLAPFVVATGGTAVVASAALSSAVLFAVGAAMSLFTGRRAPLSGLRMLLVGGLAAAITHGVGRLLHVNAAS